MKKKPKTKTQLKEELDKIFSIFIRLRDKFECCTCGKKGDKTDIDCGHYIPRSHMNTRWDEENCHAQCKGCNVFKKGNMDVYALFMVNKYGDKILIEMNKRKNTIRQWSLNELKQEISKYKEKVNSIMNG